MHQSNTSKFIFFNFYTTFIVRREFPSDNEINLSSPGQHHSNIGTRPIKRDAVEKHAICHSNTQCPVARGAVCISKTLRGAKTTRTKWKMPERGGSGGGQEKEEGKKKPERK